MWEIAAFWSIGKKKNACRREKYGRVWDKTVETEVVSR